MSETVNQEFEKWWKEEGEELFVDISDSKDAMEDAYAAGAASRDAEVKELDEECNERFATITHIKYEIPKLERERDEARAKAELMEKRLKDLLEYVKGERDFHKRTAECSDCNIGNGEFCEQHDSEWQVLPFVRDKVIAAAESGGEE